MFFRLPQPRDGALRVGSKGQHCHAVAVAYVCAGSGRPWASGRGRRVIGPEVDRESAADVVWVPDAADLKYDTPRLEL